MARMAAKERRDARAFGVQFTDEFKAGAVRLVLDEGKTVAEEWIKPTLPSRGQSRDVR